MSELPSRPFKVGEMAITVNSSFPPNNGILVIVTSVAGPRPDLSITFGYNIQRLDGLNLPIVSNGPKYSKKSALCDHFKLKRIEPLELQEFDAHDKLLELVA